MLARARSTGLQFQSGEIESIDRNSASGFRLGLRDGQDALRIDADRVVLATGPFINELAGQLGLQLPVQSFLQRKFIIPDPGGIIPRSMPFTIFADPQYLGWTDEERELIETDPEYRWLLDEFPAGLHVKPEPGNRIKLGWAYNRKPETPRWDTESDHDFPNIVLRGASRFIPALRRYVEQAPTPVVQFAGYYTRTEENWPIIGPLDDGGPYAVAALSGFGTMAGCGAGELCARWMMGEPLPDYARYFHPDRYSDPKVMAEIDAIESDGQL
jgi:glycine/D-amino acid oxidase-like deaminating enzyme